MRPLGAENLEKVREFFDERAENWDARQNPNPAVIGKILETGGVRGKVLDVACGTGVMVPFYKGRGVREVTGIDLSPKMIMKARKKFSEPGIEFMVGDAERLEFEGEFDSVVVYNAWPHFLHPLKALFSFSRALKKGGRLAIAHGMGREELNRVHSGAAASASNLLPPASELATLMEPYFQVLACADDGEMYEVAGKKIA